MLFIILISRGQSHFGQLTNKRSPMYQYFRIALHLIGFLFLSLICFNTLSANKAISRESPLYSHYVFCYFSGNGYAREAIRFAVSKDGFNFTALNNNQPILNSSKISSTGGVRDPHILRGENNKGFYMVATDMHVEKNGWGPQTGMVLMRSKNLIDWDTHVVDIAKRFPAFADVNRVWAPQTIYDREEKRYMIYWSMRFGEKPDIIYYAYVNDDFTDLITEPKQLYFNPGGGATIDGDIVLKNGLYYLFFKTEDKGKGIKVALSKHINRGYKLRDKFVQQTSLPVEGSSVFKLNNSKDYILMYDMYTSGKYQFTTSNDLRDFQIIDQSIKMDFSPRHGTVIAITELEAKRLEEQWLSLSSVLKSIDGDGVKAKNISIDTLRKKVLIPVNENVDLSSFLPRFADFASVTKQLVHREKTKLFYDFKIGHREYRNVEIDLVVWNNPILNGLYADPDILFSQRDKKYYLYPTTDGFKEWSGDSFSVFSSSDLVNWKDEGKILDLKADTKWARSGAWAPSAIEMSKGADYKYFFYFTADKKIGVASADNPQGPFRDSGAPLIMKHPDGINRGQEIDPFVFRDSVSGNAFLYWGNGYLAVQELNEDMISFKDPSPTIITPDATFREGVYVFYRNGRYYFLWSENDTRSPDYRVRYGYSSSVKGKITIPPNNILLAKNESEGILGPGHCSVIRQDTTNNWFIVYHRFCYPEGLYMGRDAGYHREICMDRLTFDSNGNLLPVVPTHSRAK